MPFTYERVKKHVQIAYLLMVSRNDSERKKIKDKNRKNRKPNETASS